MTFSTKVHSVALALAIAAGATGPFSRAMAAEPGAPTLPPVKACMDTIKSMGSSMGYSPSTGVDGTGVYAFILRSAGVDYDAICEPATGIVKDVSPRAIHQDRPDANRSDGRL